MNPRATAMTTAGQDDHVTATKAMTLRLPVDLAGELEAVAAIDGQPIAEVVRVAVADFIRKRKADPVFQVALVAWITRLERLIRRSDGAAGDWTDQHPTTLVPLERRAAVLRLQAKEHR